MINAIFIFLYDHEQPLKIKKSIDKVFNLSSLLDLPAGTIDYNPFPKMETINCIIISKEPERIVFGFRTEEDTDVLMHLESICAVSHDFGFICYYFSENNENHLAMYVASNAERQAWYGQSLTGLTIEALYALRNNENYFELCMVYELFCCYESYLSDPDMNIPKGFGLINSSGPHIENPNVNYKDLQYSGNQNINKQSGDDDLPF